jgi:hypothetical protein
MKHITTIRRLFALTAFAVLAAAFAMAQHGHDHEGHAHGAPPRGTLDFRPAAAHEPPKDALFGYDLSYLTPAQRKAIVAEAMQAPCGCGREWTVAYCLINDRRCVFSPRLANAIIERASGAPYTEVRPDYSLTDGDVPGVALAALSPAQAKSLTSRLRKAKCPCGCRMTILECLRDDPLCKASPAVLARVYREVTKTELPGVAFVTANSTPIPRYETLPGHDLSTLDAAKLARLLDIVNVRPCPCGCGMTLAQCRNEDPTCETSPKLVNTHIFAVAVGEE